MKREPISDCSDWTFEALEDFEREIGRIAAEKYRLDTYPNQIEIISADQMMSAYASVGMPGRLPPLVVRQAIPEYGATLSQGSYRASVRTGD